MTLLQRGYYDEDDYESDLRHQESVDELLNRPFGEVLSDFFLGLVILGLIVFGFIIFRDKIKSRKVFKWLYIIYAITLSVFFFKYFGIFLSIIMKNILWIGLGIYLIYHNRAFIAKYIKENILNIKGEDREK
ncbi:hypothetical protein [Sphingobacterium paucimobilis]|nr:hypothetical protein [Sphingobacterium paucimobilis]